MSSVGAFPGLSDLRRMTIRSAANPLDKSTIVSIFPKDIVEIKHTIQPGRFEIKAGTFDKPSILVVGPSSWWKETDEHAPLLEIPHSSITVAHSVVRDWVVGLLGCEPGEKQPGIFYIPGNVTIVELKTKPEYVALMEQAKARQKLWFETLVKMADILWARTNGNPLTISDDMRLAAIELTLKDKAWIKDFTHIQMVNCKACGALRNPAYPVCQACKAIDDPEKAKALGIVFAK